MEISLHEPTRELWHAFFKNLESDPDTCMNMSEFSPYQYDAQKVDALFDSKMKAQDRKEFMILCGDEVVGNIHLKHINFDKGECELAIHMTNDSFKNKGYGTQAERLAIRYAFDVLKMRTVFADAVLKNTRSQHVLEKVGFRFVKQDESYKYYRIDCRNRIEPMTIEEKGVEKLKLYMEKDGIVLKSFETGYADKYYKDCFETYDAEVDRFTGSGGRFEYDKVVNFYNRIIDDPDRYDFMIISGDRFIGESVINEIDWELRCANFRIVIFQSANCSGGIGSWVVQVTRDFAFDKLKLHRLELEVFSFNPRAKHVYEKAGFKAEGIKRDAIKDGDQYGDIIMMSILEDEWRADVFR